MVSSSPQEMNVAINIIEASISKIDIRVCANLIMIKFQGKRLVLFHNVTNLVKKSNKSICSATFVIILTVKRGIYLMYDILVGQNGRLCVACVSFVCHNRALSDYFAIK